MEGSSVRYDNSLTVSVQNYVDTILAKKLSAPQNNRMLKASAEDFRKNLCETETINTLDFVIRRYIQVKHPELLPPEQDLADLSQDTNLPWDPHVIQNLAQQLSGLSRKEGAKIEKKEWLNYLSGTKSIRDRKKAFMVAFVLKMTVEDTLDLLLACDLEPYSPRHPLDLICLFCQKRPGRYTWGQAEAMYTDFLDHCVPANSQKHCPTPGMTAQLTADLETIFGKDQSDEDAQAEWMAYMLRHTEEFPVFVKQVHRADPSNTDQHVRMDKAYFLPGYSITRTTQYQRLAQYLAILYPTYPLEKRKQSEHNDSYQETIHVAVPLDEAGIPHLPHLVRAMLTNNGLIASEFEWERSTFHSGDEVYDDASRSLEQRMKTYWSNYLRHIMAIDRLLSPEDQGTYQNYDYFRRTDALLFLYFLIDGYGKLCLGADQEEKLDALLELRESGDEFDEALDELLDKVEYLVTRFRADQFTRKAEMLRTCFDLLLVPMGYMKLYLPALFDRIFYGMLRSDDPHSLLRMVICQGEY